MAEETFLMTPGSAVMSSFLPPAKATTDAVGSARKELCFEERVQTKQIPPLLRAPHFLGNNLMSGEKNNEEDEEEKGNDQEKMGLLGEEDVANILLWGLLGVGRFPSSGRLSASHANVVDAIRPLCVAYANCVRCVHNWCFGQGEKKTRFFRCCDFFFSLVL
jgi:hypothetical protein